MGSPLDFESAKTLARSLKTIPGFPWDEDVITATALDLVRWCKGHIEGQTVTTPEQQAEWLCNEVREQWAERWLGTAAMKAVFAAKYAAKATEAKPATIADLIGRGLLRPPCPECQALGLEYCTGEHRPPPECAQTELVDVMPGQAVTPDPALVAKRREGDPTPIREIPRLTEEQMRAALADEQRRKGPQLLRAGVA